MAEIKYNRFPGGKKKALSMSYDDGREYDRRLVEIFNQNGIRGTFHLNSGTLDTDGFIRSDEVAALYRGHEVACHGVHHYDLVTLPKTVLESEIVEDRRALERLVGYPVRGLSYPYGNFNDEVVAALPALGIEYSRTVKTTQSFWVNSDFLRLEGTCHHDDNLLQVASRFLGDRRFWSFSLMYVWGHSFEFARNGNWNVIEDFCRLVGKRDDIWYATNIEVVDYINAVKALRFDVDLTRAYNPTSLDVWIESDGSEVKIPAGQTVDL